MINDYIEGTVKQDLYCSTEGFKLPFEYTPTYDNENMCLKAHIKLSIDSTLSNDEISQEFGIGYDPIFTANGEGFYINKNITTDIEYSSENSCVYKDSEGYLYLNLIGNSLLPLTLYEGDIELPYNKDGTFPELEIITNKLLGSTQWTDVCNVVVKSGKIKNSNAWKDAFSWVKVNGAWKRCIIWEKISGAWKRAKTK